MAGGSVANIDEESHRRRRDFLKATGSAAVALFAGENAFGQTAPAKSATQRSTPRAEPVDRGIWATWYDLEEDGRDQYLSWLHGTYLPALLKRPRYLWAAHYATRGTEGGSTSTQIHHTDDPAVPPGFRYILLIGAKDAFVFGDPVPSAIHAALPDEGRKMLAMRRNARVNLLTEAGRCEGRARTTYKEGLMSAPSIQIGSFNCPVEYEEEMLGGYVQSRMPAMCKDASCVRTRKLNSVSGWAKHVILYEFTSVEGYERDYEATNAHALIGLGGHSVVPNLIHAPHGPNSAERIWPPVPKA
jgi:hypothetical protein